jgi:hypothetical protein
MVALPLSVQARVVEPGAVQLGAQVGPGLRLGSELGGSRAHLVLNGIGEYAFDKVWAANLELGLGLASTVQLLARAGARYRVADLGIPVSPYGLAQVSATRLVGVIGANLWALGLRLGTGADYFLTKQWAVGALLATDLGTTLGDRPAFLGTVEILVGATYTR